MIVDLPEPLGPMTPTISRSPTAKLTWSSAATPPNDLSIRSTSNTVTSTPSPAQSLDHRGQNATSPEDRDDHRHTDQTDGVVPERAELRAQHREHERGDRGAGQARHAADDHVQTQSEGGVEAEVRGRDELDRPDEEGAARTGNGRTEEHRRGPQAKRWDAHAARGDVVMVHHQEDAAEEASGELMHQEVDDGQQAQAHPVGLARVLERQTQECELGDSEEPFP